MTKKTGVDKQYDKKEERGVVTKKEQQTALKLKEIKKGQVTRTDHMLVREQLGSFLDAPV